MPEFRACGAPQSNVKSRQRSIIEQVAYRSLQPKLKYCSLGIRVL